MLTRHIQRGARRRGKTKHAHRAIPLPAETVRVIRWHKQNQIEERNISAKQKRDPWWIASYCGAGDGTRTRTGLPPTVFKGESEEGQERTEPDLPHSDAELDE